MAFKREVKKELSPEEKRGHEKKFLEGADKTDNELENTKNDEFDKSGNKFSDAPNAPHNYKLMTARFNKHEISILDELSEIYGVDRMNVIRIAFRALAKKNDIGQQ